MILEWDYLEVHSALATCWANGGGLAPPATYIQSVDWSFRVGGVGGVGSVSSVLLLAYIDFDVDLWTR